MSHVMLVEDHARFRQALGIDDDGNNLRCSTQGPNGRDS
jgi:hypothetical protein